MSFYFLDHHPGRGVDSHRTELLKEEPVRRGEGAFCEACHKPVGPLPWLPPYRAEIHLSGREFGDIAFGAGYSVLVSDRFREAYEGAGLTGLDQFCCVEVVRISGRRRSGKEPPVYYKTDVRRGGPMWMTSCRASLGSDPSHAWRAGASPCTVWSGW